MKKVVVLVLFLSMILPATVFGAEKGISVYIDGVKLQFTSKPIQENGTTLVPLRTIFEGLGANVKWDSKTQTVKASKNGVNIEIKLGQKFATRDGKKIALTTKPRTIASVTYVPLRFIGESFGNAIEVKGKDIYIISPAPPSFEYVAKDSNTQAPSQPGSKLTVQEIGKLSNRVVYIETYDASNKPLATGSGIVVSSDGRILTNYHVIDQASTVKIEFNDQRSFTTSTLLAKDEDLDLALLKISAANLPYVNIGDSASLQLGEEVVAIGSPLGYKNSLTSGVVSQTSRQVDGQNYIQISTPIDHGSSGGALFNMKGELVGVTSALIQSSANINLAIPSSDVKIFLSKPQTEQSLSTLVQSKPAPNITAVNSAGAQVLTSYLNENYGGLTYGGLEMDFDWYVVPSKDGQQYLIGGSMKDGQQWADWVDMQDDDETAIPSLIIYLSNELRSNLKISDTFFSLFLDVYVDKYPGSFPAESITKEGSGYRLNYNFIFGSVDYTTGYLDYIIDPANNKNIQSMKIN
ncbi:trypsin-like peptidase domain-containing protein [Paenibacillus sp. YPG26]|uniref:trypsin-like peptidase domain-containing protein n=1 Tax=Paenibacillus sp. YPG26 TaxID=2878915 RepID=UPI00203C87B3|nr:trypsin-like peptidase domain-containing protein [Paenibacillus sp. YPG26]USB34428.1 trypsin-like peptidase domain-containing protein [Paenibacillus sp. YPG26]